MTAMTLSTLAPAAFMHPSAWKRQDVERNADWTLHLDAGDIAEIDRALASVKARQITSSRTASASR